MSDSSALFKPFTLGKLELANRTVMAPMTRNLSPGNVPHEGVVEYYRQRAAGGTGLIFTEGTCVNHIAANGYPDVPYFWGEERLEGWKKVADAVHAEGGKIAPQLWHVGGMRRAGTLPEGEVNGYAPSGMNVPGKVNRHVMTQQDIDDVVRAFAEGARDAKACGFDAIEIHGAHGYLLDQFFWEGTNQRTDGYGGSLDNRGRFVCEIVTACRDAVGADFPIVLRWSQWKQQDYNARLVQTPEELEQFLMPLSEAGVDIFHCSQRRFWEPEFEGSNLNLAGWTKKITGKPTITVGSVGLNADFIPAPGEATFKEAETASLDELIARLEAQNLTWWRSAVRCWPMQIGPIRCALVTVPHWCRFERKCWRLWAERCALAQRRQTLRGWCCLSPSEVLRCGAVIPDSIPAVRGRWRVAHSAAEGVLRNAAQRPVSPERVPPDSRQDN